MKSVGRITTFRQLLRLIDYTKLDLADLDL